MSCLHDVKNGVVCRICLLCGFDIYLVSRLPALPRSTQTAQSRCQGQRPSAPGQVERPLVPVRVMEKGSSKNPRTLSSSLLNTMGKGGDLCWLVRLSLRNRIRFGLCLRLWSRGLSYLILSTRKMTCEKVGMQGINTGNCESKPQASSKVPKVDFYRVYYSRFECPRVARFPKT